MTRLMDITKKIFWGLLFIALLNGCATDTEKPAGNAFFQKWEALSKESVGFSPSKPDHGIDLEQGEDKGEAATEKKNEEENLKRLPLIPISLRMNNVDVATLLRAMARSADVNIVVSENVKGRTSLFIKDAPWRQVFLGVLKANNLAYTWEGEILRILTASDLEADVKRERQRHGLKLVAPLITRIIPVQYSEAAKLKENLEKMLTRNNEEKVRGAVMVDEHTNSLIIQAIASDVEKIAEVISYLDKPTPQILIEAHIVEATSEVARQLGIQWGGLSSHGFWIYPGSQSTGVTGNSLSTGGIDPTSGLALSLPAGILSAGGLSLGIAVQDIGKSILMAQLDALQQEGKLNILSSPSITTLDNQTAKIESGDEVPVQSVSADGNTEIEYKKAVLSLEVTPHVIQDKTLKMKIITSKDELDFSRTVSGNPTIITKKAETNVFLMDGQTTVIGGLKKETNNSTRAGIPGIFKIPVIGRLFGGESSSKKLDNLLIFITPHILKERPRRSGVAEPVQQPSLLENRTDGSSNQQAVLPDLPAPVKEPETEKKGSK